MCHHFLCSASTGRGLSLGPDFPRPLYTMKRVMVFLDDPAGGGLARLEGSVTDSLCRRSRCRQSKCDAKGKNWRDIILGEIFKNLAAVYNN